MPVWGISQTLTMISCPAIWAKAAKMLRLTALKYFFGRCWKKKRHAKLSNAPLRLNTKVGVKNCPSNRLLANTLSRLTHAAVPKPYWYSTYSVTMLAMPGFTPGSGDGMTASIMCRPMAKAVSLAIWWSAGVVWILVVLSLIVERIIFWPTIANEL